MIDGLAYLRSIDLIDEDTAKFLYLRHKCKRDLYWLGTEVLGYSSPQVDKTGKRVDPSFHTWFCKELDVEVDTPPPTQKPKRRVSVFRKGWFRILVALLCDDFPQLQKFIPEDLPRSTSYLSMPLLRA